MYRDNAAHFDRDLDEILNRVYGSGSNAQSMPDRNVAILRQHVVRREQGSQELKQALADLRDRREKSQTVMRMKEEVDFLQGEILRLRELGAQITALREKLDQEEI